MICIPIIASTMEDALKDTEEASSVADCVELRLDCIKKPDLRLLLERCTKPVIVTNRPVREGGMFDGSEEDRVALLKLALELQVDYVDIEHDSRDRVQCSPESKTKLIVSYHNFRETPDNLMDIYRKLRQSHADIIKIVTYARSITDNIRIYQLLQEGMGTTPIISFCMGEYGNISRILYKIFGSYLTFASLRSGKESAPGQINIHEMLNVYQIRRHNKQTSVYGLIGNPVSHSISPIIHNTLFTEMGFNNVYVPFKVDVIDDFIKEFKKLDIKGYSVTIPHKESVISCLDGMDPLAEKIGAVNTIVNKNGRLFGFNTDCEAAIRTLESVDQASDEEVKTHGGLCGKRVAILGAGGVARAIAFGLKGRGSQVTIFNRNDERSRLLANEADCDSGKLCDLPARQIDILINATPVGMFPGVNETPVDKNILKPNMIVFDTIYNPKETKLLRDARDKGCITIGGMPMFVHQAAAQFKLWTGKTPPLEVIGKIAYKGLPA
ncbi:MAG: shikimate dehydrogenase [Candidatus Loosdrechtia sp.]|uniref:shikimate dehydrogenase n=1 Tax=Candidatus Loosdrechtia sp. TaxID=3101272 RepID=UPI003A74A9D2|nr:MAG: shikimate dehydrogenase [Candidatus Jettenia sp. AMX2]